MFLCIWRVQKHQKVFLGKSEKVFKNHPPNYVDVLGLTKAIGI
jgi:hypothetical protein